jgi:hypothetical protein
MAHRKWVLAFGMMVVAAPASASQPDPAPATGAPAGTPETRYCLHVEPFTGSLIETTQCWTREQWVDQGVDIDREWAKEGVRVIA